MSAAADLISVIIPTRNRSARLEQAVESVRAQRWKSLDIVVVDDASSDATPVLMEKLAAQDGRIRSLRNHAPQGGGGARNVGIAAARGKYVAFLDDDDQWFPRKLECQHAMLAANPAASAVSCGFVLSLTGSRKRTLTPQPPRDLQQLLRSNCLGGASVCFTTLARLQEIGGFDPGLRSGQDWDLWLKLYARGPVLVCREPLVNYAAHGEQRITSNPDSEYLGRRRIHLRYRQRMNGRTRRHSLSELEFSRRVVFARSWSARLAGLISLVASAPGLNKLRFPYRFCKLALRKGLHATS